MDFTPQFSSQLLIPQLSQQLGDERGYKKNPLVFIFVVLFLFSFFFFLLFSLYFQAKPLVPTGRVGRSRFAFVPPLWDLARRGLAGGSGCVKLSSSLSPRRKTPHVQHPVSARAGDGRG